MSDKKWISTNKNEGSFILKTSISLRDYFLNIFKQYNITGNEFAVGSALILGFEDKLNPEIISAYSSSGALHVLSVSGLHIAIIYVVLLKLLFFLDKFKNGKIIKAIILVLMLWFYACLTGLSPSVMRAATMFSFIVIAKLFNRYTNVYNTLAASALLLLIINPYLIMEVGFQLSFLAVFGIVMLQIYEIIPVAQGNIRSTLALTGNRPTGLFFNAFALGYAAIVTYAINIYLAKNLNGIKLKALYILGTILLLMGTERNAAGTMNLNDDKFFKPICLLLLLAVNKGGPICQDQLGQLLMNQKLKEGILTQIQQKFVPSFPIDQMTTLPITRLDKFQIDKLLGLFKKVLFFYRYNTLPSATYLTFDVMSRTPEEAYRAFGASSTPDSEKFKEDKDKPYIRNNQRLYREDTLLEALSGAQARPMSLGGRGRTRVKRTNKNRRMRTRRSRSRRTTRKY